MCVFVCMCVWRYSIKILARTISLSERRSVFLGRELYRSNLNYLNNISLPYLSHSLKTSIWPCDDVSKNWWMNHKQSRPGSNAGSTIFAQAYLSEYLGYIVISSKSEHYINCFWFYYYETCCHHVCFIISLQPFIILKKTLFYSMCTSGQSWLSQSKDEMIKWWEIHIYSYLKNFCHEAPYLT